MATQRPTLVILMGCVALMVAIALVNVLNLLLARAVARQGETAVRIALGASPRQVAAQHLAEGTLLVLVRCVGVAIGLVGAYLTGGLMSRLMFGVSPGDPALLGVVSVFMLGTALLASWGPG